MPAPATCDPGSVRSPAGFIILGLVGCGRLGFDPAPDANPFVAAVGTLDPSFGTSGVSITAPDLQLFAVEPSAGGYVAVGVHALPPDDSAIALLRYTAAGQLDPAYGTGGLIDSGPTKDDFGYGAAPLDANRLVIVGDGRDTAGSDDDITVGIVDAAGAPDPAFGASGYVRYDVVDARLEDTASRVTVAGASVVACGIAGYDRADSHIALARFDLSGALMTSWGTGGVVTDDFAPAGQDQCNDVTVLGDRIIVAATSGGSLFVVAAYDEMTGTRATEFASSGVFEVGSGAASARGIVASDGDVVAVGSNQGDGFVVRLGPDGTPRPSFGDTGEVRLAGIADTLTDVVAQPDGKLVVVGMSASRGIVVRLLADGTLDPGFGTGGVVEVPGGGMTLELHGVTLDAAGRIVVVGTLGAASPYAGLIARLL